MIYFKLDQIALQKVRVSNDLNLENTPIKPTSHHLRILAWNVHSFANKQELTMKDLVGSHVLKNVDTSHILGQNDSIEDVTFLQIVCTIFLRYDLIFLVEFPEIKSDSIYELLKEYFEYPSLYTMGTKKKCLILFRKEIKLGNRMDVNSSLSKKFNHEPVITTVNFENWTFIASVVHFVPSKFI